MDLARGVRELFGIEEKDDSGKKVDKTTSSAAITNSTAVMKTTVANDADAIGYISLGSLDDTVKAVKIDGAEATAENVKSGSYKVSRPFNVVTNSGKELSPVAQDFMKFVLSSDGQKVVEEEGYIPMDASGSYAASGLSGKVTIAGSSSVTPVCSPFFTNSRNSFRKFPLLFSCIRVVSATKLPFPLTG